MSEIDYSAEMERGDERDSERRQWEEAWLRTIKSYADSRDFAMFMARSWKGTGYLANARESVRNARMLSRRLVHARNEARKFGVRI
jgi:hypothetical protein